jgi:hypothetical protein
LQCCEGRLRAAFFFADHEPCFPIQPAAKTHYGGARFHSFEDFVNAPASGLLDSSFGRSACSFA